MMKEKNKRTENRWWESDFTKRMCEALFGSQSELIHVHPLATEDRFFKAIKIYEKEMNEKIEVCFRFSTRSYESTCKDNEKLYKIFCDLKAKEDEEERSDRAGRERA